MTNVLTIESHWPILGCNSCHQADCSCAYCSLLIMRTYNPIPQHLTTSPRTHEDAKSDFYLGIMLRCKPCVPYSGCTGRITGWTSYVLCGPFNHTAGRSNDWKNLSLGSFTVVFCTSQISTLIRFMNSVHPKPLHVIDPISRTSVRQVTTERHIGMLIILVFDPLADVHFYLASVTHHSASQTSRLTFWMNIGALKSIL